ncbi:O-antigen ligase family protein [Campylobacter concisus]|jgi:membrane protein|uniref:O-antigen ligase family protein n=1 Tax=Campylobacter concisus TaxID=199 RepID=UPI000D301D56|nr:O-antigen ligase family protein [Campylobacter concisus]
MKNDIVSRLYNLFLVIVLFTLPITEGLKQISLTLFVLAGIYICVKEKRQFKFDLINISLFIFVLATFISCLVNGVSASRALDPLRCMLFFFVARSVGVEKINFKFLFFALFAGFIVAFIPACVKKFTSSDPTALFELKSIGHVNHSAIFMLLVFCVALISSAELKKIYEKYIAIIVAGICVFGIMIAGSRATMYLLPIIIFSILLYQISKRQTELKLAFSLIILFSVIAIFYTYISANIIQDERFYSQLTKGVTGSETRYPIFASAFYMWLENPLFGIGSGQFKIIDITKYFPGNGEIHVSHSHNTFLTFLTEKGIVALLAYLVFQLSLFIKFIKNFRQNNIVFLALLMLMANNIISLANTTFHHENALLMLLFWALALSATDKKSTLKIS